MKKEIISYLHIKQNSKKIILIKILYTSEFFSDIISIIIWFMRNPYAFFFILARGTTSKEKSLSSNIFKGAIGSDDTTTCARHED